MQALELCAAGGPSPSGSSSDDAAFRPLHLAVEALQRLASRTAAANGGALSAPGDDASCKSSGKHNSSDDAAADDGTTTSSSNNTSSSSSGGKGEGFLPQQHSHAFMARLHFRLYLHQAITRILKKGKKDLEAAVKLLASAAQALKTIGDTADLTQGTVDNLQTL